jgi:solute carrier family 25 protein 39/40
MASFAKSPDTHGAGQDHDIITDRVAPGGPADPPDETVEITAIQKMLSATSGSLLTGLLGKSLRAPSLPGATKTNSHL